MQCKCGGQTTERVNVRGDARLVFDECRACGRCGGWRLHVASRYVTGGEYARVQFNRIAEEAA